ncbi:DnaD domain protein [Fructobacillus parabroussonetiae]|uniref:DnaD domain protein n=1 Tax=Fructobacillus parabroussonetiae TaxID=2713174 RepID=A0ABS5QXM4_9LACO|nr:DnaD domain protein [Fructobacillus parabroussonetiae]MBS9337890.1 DnaD domain protein [Fructobacillus parabroussonetiae]
MEENVKTLLDAGQTSIHNYLLLHYRDLGLDNDDMVIYLQITRLQSQGDQASPKLLAATMKVTEQAIAERLKRFVQLDLMTVQNLGNRQEYFDFTPLFDKLLSGQAVKVENPVVSAGEQSRRQVVRILQGEFGRPLSPMELQTVNQWFDIEHFDPNMMVLAIREAIANNARSLRYIESILINWQKANLTSPQAVQLEKERRRGVHYDASSSRSQQGNKQASKKQPTVPIFKLDDL